MNKKGNNSKLDAEERELLNSFERGEWKAVDRLQEKIGQYQAYATAALEAEGVISIILSKEDLETIRAKATVAGVSSQKLVANIVHQFVSGHLVEKPHA